MIAPEVDWTLTLHETALVRVRAHEHRAARSPALLTLGSRRRTHRFVEVPRDEEDDAGLRATTATFELPISWLRREGIAARVRVGGVESLLDWEEIVRRGPAPPATPPPAAKEPPAWQPAVPQPGAQPPPPEQPSAQLEEPRVERWLHPRPLVSKAAADAMFARRRAPSAGHAPRPLVRGRPQPMAHPRALGATPRQADRFPPIEVDLALLEYLPYEHAAPLLAMPISLAGDVLTVAVALPSVDLSVITERTPWLEVRQVVAGYSPIVRALREVEALLDLRAVPWPPERRVVLGPAGDPAAQAAQSDAEAPSDGAGGWRPRDSRPRPPSTRRGAARLDALRTLAGVCATAPVALGLGAFAFTTVLAIVLSGRPGPEVAGMGALSALFLAAALFAVVRELVAYGRQHAECAVAGERRRLARELHDGVAQELAFIVSQASSLARNERPSGGPLRNIVMAAERAMVDARRSILTLTTNDEPPLVEAMLEQASQWAARAGLQLEIEIAEEIDTTPEVEHALLRIVQEAISNAVRHSGATKLTVSVSQRDGSVTARISDDGRGFDARRGSSLASAGFGLLSMTERAAESGGRLSLESEPGQGTVVEVAF